MNDRLGADVRAYFDKQFEPSPGLAERVVGRLGQRPEQRPYPRLVGILAVALAAAIVIPLVAVALANRGLLPGSNGADQIALSIGAVTPSGAWLIERGLPTTATDKTSNGLYASTDEGRTWTPRLRFAGIYDGMSFTPDGSQGVLWTIDMEGSGCGKDGRCSSAPTYRLFVYSTSDAGRSWTARTPTTWPAEIIYFRGIEGWVVSHGPMGGSLVGSAPLYHTTDGGATWTRAGAVLDSMTTMFQVFGVNDPPLRFTDSSTGWFTTWQPAASGPSGLYVTRDGGSTWSEQTLPAPAGTTGYDMVVELPVGFGNRWVLPVGLRRHGGADNATANLIYMYSSTDGGRTWNDPKPMLGDLSEKFQPVGDRWQAFYLDADHWWLSSQSSTAGDKVQASPAVARTVDGGRAWQIFKPAPRILEMAFSDAQHGFAEDVTGAQNTNGLLVTSDGGAHWTRVQIPTV